MDIHFKWPEFSICNQQDEVLRTVSGLLSMMVVFPCRKRALFRLGFSPLYPFFDVQKDFFFVLIPSVLPKVVHRLRLLMRLLEVVTSLPGGSGLTEHLLPLLLTLPLPRLKRKQSKRSGQKECEEEEIGGERGNSLFLSRLPLPVLLFKSREMGEEKPQVFYQVRVSLRHQKSLSWPCWYTLGKTL